MLIKRSVTLGKLTGYLVINHCRSIWGKEVKLNRFPDTLLK